MTLGSKDLWIALGFCLIAAGMACAAPQWISLDGSSEMAPLVQVLEHNASATRLELDLHGLYSEEVAEAGEVFQVLSFGDWGSTMDVGYPMLPTINERVGIPARTDLRVRVSDIKSVTLHNYRPYPFQTPTTDEAANLPFVLDQQAYARDELYPREIAEVSLPQIWRDVRLTELRLTPLRYNPVTRELHVITSCKITIEYFGANSHHALDREPAGVLPPYAKMYRASLINYDWLEWAARDLDLPGTKYLFVMKSEAQPYVQPLVDLRNAQGYKAEVKIFPSGASFDDEYDIKAYIQSLYNSSRLEYVLLVGDAFYYGGPGAVDVPMHMWVDSYSDSWYTSLQGDNDYYADLAIGRIVYDNTTQLSHQIDKIMDYLQTPNTSSNWMGNSLLVAHQEQYPLKYTQCKEEIRTFNYAIQTPTFATAYGGAGATNNQVINYINTNGTGLLNYRGHGSTTEWWQWGPSGSFTATHVNQLTNTGKYFVHFDVCCDNMDFPSYNGDCLAESFMKAPAAAIAINGAIIPSYTIPNHDYDKEFYKGLFNYGIWNIGYASNYANVTVVNVHGAIGQSNYRTYLWLGDAATDLWTAIPQPLAISAQSSYNLATQDFNVTVTKSGQPVANALVCAKSTNAYARGYTNSSGVATLVFLEYPSTTTTVTLTASAHNGLQATGSTIVIPANAPYNLTVDINPVGSTIIPPSGGSFSFTADIWNNEAYPVDATVWTDWIYPNGTLHAPFINRYLTLAPGLHINRTPVQTVAGSEPPGTYTFRACVGTYQGGSIFAMDTFNFTKSSADGWAGRTGTWIQESATYGWDEGDDLIGETAQPRIFGLSHHPNPFNPAAIIRYQLPVNSQVSLQVYDTAGKLVQELVNGWRSAGTHEVTFDGSNLASGVYLYRMEAGEYNASGKLILLK